MVAVSASVCWKSGHDVGQQFQCVRASFEALSVRVSGRERCHRSAAAVFLQVKLTEHGRHTRLCKDRAVVACCTEHSPVCFVKTRRLPLSPPDFSSRWFLKHVGREEENPRRSMLDRTWLRSSVCWVSLQFTDTMLTVCACESNLRKF